jgi:hypothetical protein
MRRENTRHETLNTKQILMNKIKNSPSPLYRWLKVSFKEVNMRGDTKLELI